MGDNLRLYSYWRSSAAYRVRIGLNLKGLEYEIVVAAVRASGDEVAVRYAPMERLHLAIGRGELDGIATTNAYSGVQVFYSQP